jgi:hypothetical protein
MEEAKANQKNVEPKQTLDSTFGKVHWRHTLMDN